MVPTGTGSYRFDSNATGIQTSVNGRWADGRNPYANTKLVDPSTGAMVAYGSPQGQSLLQARKKQAADWAKNQQSAEMAGVNAQEVEDRIAENKDRNAQVNSLAHSQAGQGMRGGQGIGRGIFQRGLTGQAPSRALSDLNSANAKSLADARRTALAASQKANVGYQNPSLGYASAVNEITKNFPKAQDGTGAQLPRLV